MLSSHHNYIITMLSLHHHHAYVQLVERNNEVVMRRFRYVASTVN